MTNRQHQQHSRPPAARAAPPNVPSSTCVPHYQWNCVTSATGSLQLSTAKHHGTFSETLASPTPTAQRVSRETLVITDPNRTLFNARNSTAPPRSTPQCPALRIAMYRASCATAFYETTATRSHARTQFSRTRPRIPVVARATHDSVHLPRKTMHAAGDTMPHAYHLKRTPCAGTHTFVTQKRARHLRRPHLPHETHAQHVKMHDSPQLRSESTAQRLPKRPRACGVLRLARDTHVHLVLQGRIIHDSPHLPCETPSLAAAPRARCRDSPCLPRETAARAHRRDTDPRKSKRHRISRCPATTRATRCEQEFKPPKPADYSSGPLGHALGKQIQINTKFEAPNVSFHTQHFFGHKNRKHHELECLKKNFCSFSFLGLNH